MSKCMPCCRKWLIELPARQLFLGCDQSFYVLQAISVITQWITPWKACYRSPGIQKLWISGTTYAHKTALNWTLWAAHVKKKTAGPKGTLTIFFGWRIPTWGFIILSEIKTNKKNKNSSPFFFLVGDISGTFERNPTDRIKKVCHFPGMSKEKIKKSWKASFFFLSGMISTHRRTRQPYNIVSVP